MTVIVTIKLSTGNVTRKFLADDERDFQRQIERAMAETGAIGFGRQSTTYWYRP